MSRLRNFAWSAGNTFYCSVNKGPDFVMQCDIIRWSYWLIIGASIASNDHPRQKISVWCVSSSETGCIVGVVYYWLTACLLHGGSCSKKFNRKMRKLSISCNLHGHFVSASMCQYETHACARSVTFVTYGVSLCKIVQTFVHYIVYMTISYLPKWFIRANLTLV